VGGVGLGRQAEGDVAEAGVERLADRVPGGAGLVVRHVQVDRAGDSGGVAAGLGAEAVQQCAALGGVGGVAARDVPQVRVLGGDPEHGGRASGDENGRVRLLDGLRVAERAGEIDVGAMEVKRLALCPQPPDDGAGFGEVLDGVTEVVVRQAVRLVLVTRQRVAGT